MGIIDSKGFILIPEIFYHKSSKKVLFVVEWMWFSLQIEIP